MPSTAPPATAEETDEALAARGDVEGLYNRYARRLLGFLATLRIPPSDRGDVHHEVWVRVCKQLTEGYQNDHFRGWLFTIARNLATDWLRRRRPVPIDHEYDHEDERVQTPAERLEEDEHRERFQHCLDLLPAAESALVRGRIDGVDYEQLATKLGLTIKIAYRMFFEVKAKLQKCTERSGS